MFEQRPSTRFRSLGCDQLTIVTSLDCDFTRRIERDSTEKCSASLFRLSFRKSDSSSVAEACF